MSAIELDTVSLRYVDAAADALDGISLDIESGAVTWLHGAPGAGSSTLLLVLGGYAPRFTGGALRGRIRMLGADPQTEDGRAALRGRVAYVTAVPALQLSGIAATVWEEIAFAPANLGWPIETIRTSVDTVLDRLGIRGLSTRNPLELSGGELQRVVVAAVAVLEPSVWLLDEPATALDAGGRARLFDVMISEARRGAAVVVASEDVDALGPVADRLIVLQHGRVVLDGRPAELLSGDAVWAAGAAGTAYADIARRAAGLVASPRLAPPYPLDLALAVTRWS